MRRALVFGASDGSLAFVTLADFISVLTESVRARWYGSAECEGEEYVLTPAKRPFLMRKPVA